MIQRIIHFLLIITLVGNLFAQEDENEYHNSGKQYHTSNYASLNINYNILKSYKKSNFHNYFENRYGSKYSQETYAIGINMAGPIEMSSNYKPGKHFDCHVGIHHQFTNTLNPTDSISYNFQAFHFNLALGKDLFYNWTNIDLPVRFGFDGGMAFLKNNSILSRNPFLNLMGQVELRFVLWKIVLGSKLEIGYDITSKNWKSKNDHINNELSYKNHYSSLQFSLGYNLFKPLKKSKPQD